MSTVLLAYAPLQGEVSTWMHLLQQQTVYETVRAVLAAHNQRGPELSEHTLFAPAHLDILPIVAIVARDYADFVEPEGVDRPSRTPISLYGDPSWQAEPGLPMMDRLLHPAWFQAPVPLEQIVREHRPDVCIAAGEPRSIASQLRGLDHRFRQILVFESLMRGGADIPAMPGTIVRVESRINQQVLEHTSQLDDPILRNGVWRSMLDERESLDLEPFQPFGLGIEMAIRGQ